MQMLEIDKIVQLRVQKNFKRLREVLVMKREIRRIGFALIFGLGLKERKN